LKTDILAFGAHPDDVELAAGGTLLKAARAGSATGVITLTRGETGTRGSLETRAAEFDAASRLMGLAHHEMLSLPDGRLAADEESKLAVVREIREHRPTILLLPYWEDRHPDHGAASRIVQEAAFLAGLRKLDTGQEPFRPAELVYYMSSWEFEPSFVVDISAHIEEKKRAIQAYGTQVYNPAPEAHFIAAPEAHLIPSLATGEEQTFISSEHFWQLLLSRMAHYGRLIGASFAEPFRIRGLVEIADLVGAFGKRVY
jgi:bacillithiol biosynthesis deacetylase BshB1